MSRTIRCIIAPGRFYQVPGGHPSGLFPGDFFLNGGDAIDVTEEQAGVLWAKRIILHPTTGEAPPASHTPQNQGVVTVTTNGREVRPNEVAVAPSEEQEARQARLDAEVDARNAAVLENKRLQAWGAEKGSGVSVTQHGGGSFGSDPMGGPIRLFDNHGEI